MSEQTPSQDSPSDGYNYLDDLKDQLDNMGVTIGDLESFETDFGDDNSYDEVNEYFEMMENEGEDVLNEWNELLDIANEPDPGPNMTEMLWAAERKKEMQRYNGVVRGRMKLSFEEDWFEEQEKKGRLD